MSLGTPWGLFRHYWVALKVLITAFSTVILIIYMGTFRQMAGVAADPVIEIELVRNPSPLLHAVLALILLLTATVLAVYKPFGMTTYGGRKQAEGDHHLARAASADPLRSSTAWSYVTAVVAVVLALLLLMHFAGMHH